MPAPFFLKTSLRKLQAQLQFLIQYFQTEEGKKRIWTAAGDAGIS